MKPSSLKWIIMAIVIPLWLTILFVSAHYFGADSLETKDLEELGEELIEDELTHT
jgi:hypothetical protein